MWPNKDVLKSTSALIKSSTEIFCAINLSTFVFPQPPNISLTAYPIVERASGLDDSNVASPILSVIFLLRSHQWPDFSDLLNLIPNESNAFLASPSDSSIPKSLASDLTWAISSFLEPPADSTISWISEAVFFNSLLPTLAVCFTSATSDNVSLIKFLCPIPLRIDFAAPAPNKMPEDKPLPKSTKSWDVKSSPEITFLSGFIIDVIPAVVARVNNGLATLRIPAIAFADFPAFAKIPAKGIIDATSKASPIAKSLPAPETPGSPWFPCALSAL